MPRESQNSGKSMLNTLNRYAMPVLLATRVSMLAVRCLSCFHALMKKPLPSQKTTGVDSAHIIYSAYGMSMKNIPMTATGSESTIAQIVLDFSCAYLSSCAFSASSAALPSFCTSKSYPASCTAFCSDSAVHSVLSYSTLTVAAA